MKGDRSQKVTDEISSHQSIKYRKEKVGKKV